MGSIAKRKRKYGHSYRAQVMVNGERITKTFDDEIQARICETKKNHWQRARR